MEEKPKATRSRRKRQPANPRFIDPDGMVVNECYCRKCKRMRHPKEFLEATDKFLDANGKMSVCNECIDTMYKKMLLSEKDMGKAILRMCRVLNVAYVPRAIAATISHAEKMESKGKEQDGVFGIYKSKVSSLSKINDNPDLTFQEPGISNLVFENIGLDDSESEEELKQFWGEGFSFEDYQFLENELAEWKKSFSCNNRSEEFYLKEICLKQLDIRKARIEGKDVDAKIKAADAILKSAALTPAQANAASSGKVNDTWGSIIKIIEETTPAEYYKDKKLFADFDGLGKYINNYIVRSLKNFVTGSRDFNIVEDETAEDDNYYSIDEPPTEGS